MTVRPTLPSLRLTLFGGPSLSKGSGILSLSPLQGALLGILAAYGQRGIRRGELIELLWSDGNDVQLRRRLNQLIYSLHQRLRNGRLIRLVGDIYMFEDGLISSDLDSLLAALRDRKPAKAIGTLGRGFLSGLESTPGPAFERWVETRELRLRSDVRTLASEQWMEGEQRADWEMAEEAADTLLQLDPKDESSLRKLIESRALRGKVREAEATYEEFVEFARIEDPAYEPEEETGRLISRLAELSSHVVRSRISSSSRPEVFPFVGRVEELESLRQATRLTRVEGLQSLVVLGESGIGKTRLIQEVLSRLPFDGIHVLSGRCSEFQRNIPLSPILGALSSDWVSRNVRELDDPWRRHLLNLLPECSAQVYPDAQVAWIQLEDIPRVTCEALFRLLQILTKSNPAVLFLDDFHWIDATSLSVLEYIRERWEGVGLFTLLAVRTGEIEPNSPLDRWLNDETGGNKLPSLSLGPLGRNDMARLLLSSHRTHGLLDGSPPESTPKWLELVLEFADGHPLLGLECVRTLLSTGGEVEIRAGRIPVPNAIERLVAARVSQLSEEGRGLVQVLSVSEKPVPVSILESGCAFAPGAIGCAIDEGVRRQLIIVTPKGIDFQHGILRSAVYQGLSPGTRVEAHRGIADALSTINDSSLFMDIALHLLAAGDPRRAMPFVLGATRLAAEAGGWIEARVLIEAALESSPTPPERGELAARLARLLMFLGDFTTAEARWEEAVTAYREAGLEEDALYSKLGSLEARRNRSNMDNESLLSAVRELRDEAADQNLRKLVAECMNVEIRLLDGLRRVHDVREMTLEALNLVDPEDVDTHVELLCVSAIEAVYGDPGRADRLAEQAAEIALDHQRPDLQLKALNRRIVAYYHQARLSTKAGRSLIHDAITVAQSSSNYEQRFSLECNLGAWYVEAGEYTAAERSFRRAGTALEKLPIPSHRRNLLLNRGQLALELEDPDAAIEYFSEALDSRTGSVLEPFRCFALAGLGLARFARGELGEARRIHEELPAKPSLWTFDPFLWLSFEAKMIGLSVDRPTLLSTMRDNEVGLQEAVPTAWIRLRLLRYSIAIRSDCPPQKGEIEVLSAFIDDRDLRERREELNRILTKNRPRR